MVVKRIIQVPRETMRRTPVLISDHGQVGNLLVAALSRQGFTPPTDQPARWGFGALVRPVELPGGRRLLSLGRVVVGSSDPDIARAIQALRSEDLLEERAVPGEGLDLRNAEILDLPTWPDAQVGAFYCVTPIRLSDYSQAGTERPVIELTDDFSDRLNLTMERRFGRPFHLHFIPDGLYVRVRKNRISASLRVKTLPNNRYITHTGVSLPFVLSGPVQDLRDAWCSGLGRSTASGFGMLEIQK